MIIFKHRPLHVLHPLNKRLGAGGISVAIYISSMPGSCNLFWNVIWQSNFPFQRLSILQGVSVPILSHINPHMWIGHPPNMYLHRQLTTKFLLHSFECKSRYLAIRSFAKFTVASAPLYGYYYISAAAHFTRFFGSQLMCGPFNSDTYLTYAIAT